MSRLIDHSATARFYATVMRVLSGVIGTAVRAASGRLEDG